LIDILSMLPQVRVRDSDQAWIYTTFTCRASNEFGTEGLPIALRRASEYV